LGFPSTKAYFPKLHYVFRNINSTSGGGLNSQQWTEYSFQNGKKVRDKLSITSKEFSAELFQKMEFSIIGLPNPFSSKRKLDLSDVNNYKHAENFSKKYIEAKGNLLNLIQSKPGKKGEAILEIMDSMQGEFQARVVDKLNSVTLDLSKKMREEFVSKMHEMVPCDPGQLQEFYNSNARRICESMKEKLKNVGDPVSIETIVGKALLVEYGYEKHINSMIFQMKKEHLDNMKNQQFMSVNLEEKVKNLIAQLDKENSGKLYIVGAKYCAEDVWVFPGVTIDCTKDLSSLVDGNIKSCIAYNTYRNWGKNDSWKDAVKWFILPKKICINYTVGKSERRFAEFRSGDDIVLPTN